MKFPLLTCLITALGCLFAQGQDAPEDINLFGKAKGQFVNPHGDAGMTVTGTGSAYFTWGEETSLRQGINSLTFTGSGFLANPGQPFNVGKLDYYNGDTRRGTNADQVTLQVSLQFEDGASTRFELPFQLVSTPNSGSHHDNADIVQISMPPDETIIRIAGKPYALRVTFGESTQKGFSRVDRFHVFEGFSAQADLRVELIPPSPATLSRIKQESEKESTRSPSDSGTARYSRPDNSQQSNQTNAPSDPNRTQARTFGIPSRYEQMMNPQADSQQSADSRPDAASSQTPQPSTNRPRTGKLEALDQPSSAQPDPSDSSSSGTSRLSFSTPAPRIEEQPDNPVSTSRLFDPANTSTGRKSPALRESMTPSSLAAAPTRLAYEPTVSAPTGENAPGLSQRPETPEKELASEAPSQSTEPANNETITPRPIRQQTLAPEEASPPAAAPKTELTPQASTTPSHAKQKAPTEASTSRTVVTPTRPSLVVVEEKEPGSTPSVTSQAADGEVTYLSGKEFRIRRAVNIEFFAKKGYSYQVQVSIDDDQWVDFGPKINGAGEQASFYHPVGDTQIKRYRVAETKL